MSSQKKRHRRKLDEEIRSSSRSHESSKMQKSAEKPAETPKQDTKEAEKQQVNENPPLVEEQVNEKRNGSTNETTPVEVVIVIDGDTSEEKTEPELEPLIADGDDPELQFDNVSDAESFKSSPGVNRCATRRSQTRNIPTPITPKSQHDVVNGDEKSNGLHPDDETPQNEQCNNQPSEPDVVEMDALSLVVEETVNDGPTEETPSPNTSQLSTQVNIGSDTTREADLTVPEENSFLNSAKDLSVVETLRRMSSRRAIRPDCRKTLLKLQAERHEMRLQQQQPRVSIERITGSKRKTRSKTPEDNKRFKPDANAGLFSYLSSPISMLRNRFAGAESISASTPKLTSYRAQQEQLVDDPELSEIKDTKPMERKRCTIM